MNAVCMFSSEPDMAKEFVEQQSQLIAVLKQEIVRLQEGSLSQNQLIARLSAALESAQNEISGLKEKIKLISENNEALLRTVQVFQREFLQRHSQNHLGRFPSEQLETGLFQLQIIRTLKSVLMSNAPQPMPLSCRSPFAEYYGLFLQEQSVEQAQVVLFNQIVENRNVRPAKVRSLGRKNFFRENFRHAFWSVAIDNKLSINEKLYNLLCVEVDGDRPTPPSSIIQLDLRRMDLKIDGEQSLKVQAEIRRLLHIFEVYRPDISYVQGMSYLAWIFLIRMDIYTAFRCFCNVMMGDSFINGLYSFDEVKIRTIIAFFEECLQDKKPKLFKHMQQLGVESELFCIEWAYTFYSRAFSLRIVSKIWDMWFCEGYNVFFKVAMTLFDLFEEELLELQENDKFVETIKNYSFKVDEKEFLKNLCKQKLFQQLKLE